eukprot:TRINITY_DN3744_c0_g1_i4.p1 TRINITY_DN3744_c0_g1~~TRINITY_DN3744_c0_g1_i4.p1  ORF type:complete len:1163 (+),score=303.99 TRINITY_DN3744_c0_g1_i4:37-3489(+)
MNNESSEKQWRKITYGLSGRPVEAGSSRSLPAAKKATGVTAGERVRQEAEKKKKTAGKKELQPFASQTKISEPAPPPLSQVLRHAFRTPEVPPQSTKKIRAAKKLPPIHHTKHKQHEDEALSLSSSTSTVPDVSMHLPLTVVQKVRSDISREHASHTIAGAADDTPPLTDLTPEQHQQAAAALSADQACSNRILIESMRHLLLAHTAYRVPTGSEFWDRIKAIQQGTSRASAAEVFRKHRREATALQHNVHDFLNRIYMCTGRRIKMVACTSLDLDTFEKFGIESPESSSPKAIDDTIDSTLEAARLFRVGESVLVKPFPWKAKVKCHEGGWVTVYTDDGETVVREEEVSPRGGYPKGWPVTVLDGTKIRQHGKVTGSSRQRIGVRIGSEVKGFVATAVFTDQPFAKDRQVIVQQPQITGKVVGHGRGRVGVQTPDGMIGCMPGTLSKVQGSNESLWTLATAIPGLSALKAVASVRTDEEEEEERTTEEEKIIMQEAPVVAPGWLLAADENEPTEVTICIAGTQNLNDCFRDCMFIPVNLELPPLPTEVLSPRSTEPNTPEEFKGLKVHMGFLDGANRIFEQIVPAVINQRRKHGPLRLTLTGHSLGGATALLLATFLDVSNLDGVCVESVFTYGAPNILNIKEWDGTQPILKEVNVNQYVNERDVVPRSLGSSLVRKLAKVGIRMGFKALSCVTTNNAESLPHYRFTSPFLHYISSGKVSTFSDRAEQQKVLSLSLAGMRPQAVQDHKMAEYINALLQIYNKETSHEHVYKLEPTLNASNAVGGHAILSAVFDTKDQAKLSSSMLNACNDIYTRMDGIDTRKLSALCFWSSKVYPEACMASRVFSGNYTMVPHKRVLDNEGFVSFMEDACYSDLPWVARLLECMDWVQDGDKVKKTKGEGRCHTDIPKPPPMFRGIPLIERGVLGCEATVAAKKIFKTYSRHLPMDAYSPERVRGGSWSPQRKTSLLRPECMRALLGSLEICEFGEGHVPEQTRLVALATSCVEDLRGIEGQGRLVDPFGNISQKGFLRLFLKWCEEDEVRIWGILCNGGGYNELLTMHNPKGALWEVNDLDEIISEVNEDLEQEQMAKQMLYERQVRHALYKIYAGRNTNNSNRKVRSLDVTPTPQPPRMGRGPVSPKKNEKEQNGNI